jgi:hypothetical protein
MMRFAKIWLLPIPFVLIPSLDACGGITIVNPATIISSASYSGTDAIVQLAPVYPIY